MAANSDTLFPDAKATRKSTFRRLKGEQVDGWYEVDRSREITLSTDQANI